MSLLNFEVFGEKCSQGWNVLYTRNLVDIGNIYMEIDGVYVFEPNKERFGCWGEGVLREVCDFLSEINKEVLDAS